MNNPVNNLAPMPVKDTFPYEDRWDSVGFDCSDCQHFRGPEKWPDTNRVSRCEFHHVSLALELQENGSKLWEWFCRDFADAGTASRAPLKHFHLIHEQLEPRVLYRFYGTDGFLLEYKMEDLETK